MPDFLPGAVFSGIATVVFVILMRARAGKPRLPVWKLALAGIAAAYVLPWAVTLLARAWHAAPMLPDLPVVTSDQVFIGVWVALFALGVGHWPGKRPFVPLWAGLLAGVAVAALLPPFLYWTSGSYQRSSIRADINQCMGGKAGQSGLREIVNTCDEPIVVGLCLPGEINPAPCTQTSTLLAGQTGQFDPGTAGLSSLPSNPNGYTLVACRPPARPSRMLSTMGRGHEGVCLPPA